MRLTTNYNNKYTYNKQTEGLIWTVGDREQIGFEQSFELSMLCVIMPRNFVRNSGDFSVLKRTVLLINYMYYLNFI